MGGKKPNTSEGRQGSKRKEVKKQKKKNAADNDQTPRQVKVQQPHLSQSISPSRKQKTKYELRNDPQKKELNHESISNSQKTFKEKNKTPDSNKGSNNSKSPSEKQALKKNEPKEEKTKKIIKQTLPIKRERSRISSPEKTPQKTQKNSSTKNQNQKKSNKKQPNIPSQPLKVEEVPEPIQQQVISGQSHSSPQQDENDESNQLQRGIPPGTDQPKDSSQNLRHHSDSRSFGNSRD